MDRDENKKDNLNEEYAGEIAVPASGRVAETREEREVPISQTGKTVGWAALILAIASLFFWPAILGPAAAVTGMFAFFLGNRRMGTWSIVLGLVAIIAFFYLVPYYS